MTSETTVLVPVDVRFSPPASSTRETGAPIQVEACLWSAFDRVGPAVNVGVVGA